MRAILEAADDQIARILLEKTGQHFAKTSPKAIRILEEGFEDATAVLALPGDFRVSVRGQPTP